MGRMVFLWHRADSTGAVWDDTNARLHRMDADAMSRQYPSLPWATILPAWSALPTADGTDQRIYGRALTSGARSGD